jgi:hypothetical protein
MILDFDLGRWSASGSGLDLSFLLTNLETDIRLEIADFAASCPAILTRKGSKFTH